MRVKEIVKKGTDIGLKVSIEIPKYLFGVDIHKSSAKRRKAIRENEDTLGNRVLKLSLNYAWEGFREAVRYTPLVLEGLILYKHATDDLPLSTWLCTSALMRLIEGKVIVDHKELERRKGLYEELNRTFEKINELFEESCEHLRGLDDVINDDLKFRAMMRGRLLANPHAVLGVAESASTSEINQAYRAIAMQCHPDTNDGDESKTERFIEATQAYHQLTGQYQKL